MSAKQLAGPDPAAITAALRNVFGFLLAAKAEAYRHEEKRPCSLKSWKNSFLSHCRGTNTWLL